MQSEIIHGDCLEIVRGMNAESVDAIITDPPYAVTSEASSSISRARRAVRETQFFEAWLREHLREWVRILKPTGAVWLTLDWRGAMILDAACARLNLREPKIGVWDRECIGLGHLLRNSYECFAIVPLAGFKRQRADEPDIWRHRWTQGGRQSTHKAEKPVDLLRRACRLVAAPDSLVVDPFCGSGSTGVAAIAENMRFIGIEREEEFVEIARARLGGAPQ